MAVPVLVVDPSADGRSYLGHVLGAAGYEVRTADGLPAARRAARSVRPRAVFVSAGTGDEAGTSLAAGLAADPLFARCGVIAIARDAAPDVRLALLRAGATDVLEDPLNRRFLAARLRAMARPRSVADELALREETTRALGLSEPAVPIPPMPGRIAVHSSDPDAASRTIAELSRHMSDRLIPAPSAEAAGAEVGLLLVTPGDDADAVAALRASLHETRLLAVLGDGHGTDAAAALDMGADDVAGAGDDPAELALRLRALVRQAHDRARCRARLADGLDSAHRDALTGLWNRRYAEPHLSQLAEAALAAAQPLAVLVLDIDRFKSVNDRHGHPAGDAVLREVASRLEGSIRVADLLARLGGEEFLVALPDTGPEQARAVAERLCTAVTERPIALPGGDGVAVTLSAGLAHMRQGQPNGMVAARQLVAAADRALYRAKAAGRARVTEAV